MCLIISSMDKLINQSVSVCCYPGQVTCCSYHCRGELYCTILLYPTKPSDVRWQVSIIQNIDNKLNIYINVMRPYISIITYEIDNMIFSMCHMCQCCGSRCSYWQARRDGATSSVMTALSRGHWHHWPPLHWSIGTFCTLRPDLAFHTFRAAWSMIMNG